MSDYGFIEMIKDEPAESIYDVGGYIALAFGFARGDPEQASTLLMMLKQSLKERPVSEEALQCIDGALGALMDWDDLLGI